MLSVEEDVECVCVCVCAFFRVLILSVRSDGVVG